LRKLKEEIRTLLVERGDVRDHIASIECLDVTGNYEKGKSFIGGLGG
jgi:hypothetical protein